MQIIDIEQIKALLDIPLAIKEIEAGFVALSSGAATVPPIGYLGFSDPPGDCHIKYGYIHGDDIFVIKAATGFFENPSIGLPTHNGLMLIMSAKTGAPIALLDDGGYLTEVRTAIAGAISAKYLAPNPVQCIGIVGAGFQSRMQLEYLRHATDCRRVKVWARRKEQAQQYQRDLCESGFDVELADDLQELCHSCNLIVTTTPATEVLIRAEWIRPGTHITAMGSDSPGKQELDPALFRQAKVCAADSISQCLDHGEAHHAVAGQYVKEQDLVELGQIIAGTVPGRTSPEDITIADLTGVAVQDIQIAKSVWAALRQQPQN